jgi:drug/metabolite transporter (DMT)-like permease
MSKPPATAVLPRVSHQVLACAGIGLLLGQMVMGIAARHEGSIAGLSCALIFLLSASASVALFLKHQHVEKRPRGETAPMRDWIATLGAGVLASIYYGALL